MSTLKNTVLKVLPRPLLSAMKRVHYTRVVKNFSMSDWPYGKVARLFVAEGGQVVDVGANIGYISGLLARWVGASGKVYSFEPVPETFALLDHNMRTLQFNQVTRFQCAASSSSGTAQMEIPHYSGGGENFYQSHIVGDSVNPDSRTVPVELRRLDEVLAQGLEHISFMKIDVEGHELDVIGGAGQLLESAHPALLIEVGGSPEEEGSSAQQLFERLRQLGYSAWVMTHDGLRPRSASDKPVDYFFLTPAHCDTVAASGLAAAS